MLHWEPACPSARHFLAPAGTKHAPAARLRKGLLENPRDAYLCLPVLLRRGLDLEPVQTLEARPLPQILCRGWGTEGRGRATSGVA